MSKAPIQAVITLAGAVAGGVAGYAIFIWLTRNHGALGYAIPGVAVSIGASLGRCPWKVVAVVCGVIGLFAGIYSAWKVAPFIADRSFGYFVSHVHQIQQLSLVLIIAGGLIAFWIPFRRCPKRIS